MEIRVLRYFLAVTQEESISGAAEYLHLTQPTLSRQMMDLEEELGKKLFIRGKRKIILTEEGLLLRKRASEIIDLVDKTASEFNEGGEALSGDIYIGGGETDAIRLIAQVIRSFRAEHPGVRYHLFSGNADDVTERLDKGLLDFGILVEPADTKKYDCIRLPTSDTWGLLMRRDSPLAEKDCIRPEDLTHLPLLTSRQTLVRNDFDQWLGRKFESLEIVATYNLLYNASRLVDEGVGYALCLDKLVGTSGDSRFCFRPLEPRMEVGLDIVWKKYQVFSKATALFLERLQEQFS